MRIMEPTDLRPGKCCHSCNHFIEDDVNHPAGVAGICTLHQSANESLNAVVHDSYGLLVRAHMLCSTFSTTAPGLRFSGNSVMGRVQGLKEHVVVTWLKQNVLIIAIMASIVMLLMLSTSMPHFGATWSIAGIGISVVICWAFNRARTQGEMMKP